jgi:glyoxylase-like metal-dependent hydrolase (beta-lactamase superfamily II)
MCPPAARLALGSDRLVCHCLLVETGADGLVLVDTGFGSADVAPPGRLGRATKLLLRPKLTDAETAIALVRALGFDRDDVRHIVTTHLDLDHAGGLADFPRARVHVHASEVYGATMGPTTGERYRYIPEQWSHAPRWETYADAGDDWYGFEAVRPLRGVQADIALVPLIGHTRGHSGVAVRDTGGWLLHAGDAYYHRGALAEPPEVPAGLRVFEAVNVFDGEMRAYNAARLRELHQTRAEEIDIFCAHDPVELDRYTG